MYNKRLFDCIILLFEFLRQAWEEGKAPVVQSKEYVYSIAFI